MTDHAAAEPPPQPEPSGLPRRRSILVIAGLAVVGALIATLVAISTSDKRLHRASATTARTIPPATATPNESNPTLSPHEQDVYAAAAARNRRLARAEATRLAAIPAPPGTEAGLAPGSAAHRRLRATGGAGNSHQFDVVHYYSVPLALIATRDWFRAHPPQGRRLSGSSSSGSVGHRSLYGLAWDAPASAAWREAETQVAMIANGVGATAVRVDGQVTWYDPTPVRVTPFGPTLRVTTDGGCPVSDRLVTDISNPLSPDLLTSLVPDESPTAELVCRYRGMNGGTPFRLLSQSRVTGKEAAAAAAHFRHLLLGSTGGGPVHCFAIDGSATIAAFSYPDRPDVDVWEPESCRGVDNGFILASYGQ